MGCTNLSKKSKVVNLEFIKSEKLNYKKSFSKLPKDLQKELEFIIHK